ncbi:MAG: flagellar biosynthetic protein FliO, partial [Bacteriovoracaceae bacterium]
LAAAPAAKKTMAKKAAAKKTAVQKDNVKKEYLNEDYLNSLLKVDKKEEVVEGKVIRPTTDKDAVKTGLAAPAKSSNTKSSFSMVEYAGKFAAFLAVVLLFFYGIVTLMKKGFIKKGKLGFLNKTGQIEVLTQTHIAPKKSLMMIRAHNQVFLVSNTDSGIHPISEIKDVAGFLKDGEKKIAGNNFDDSLVAANDQEPSEEKVKLKEDISKSNKQSSLSDFIGVKDKVKFSDQIKKKVKDLKPLH